MDKTLTFSEFKVGLRNHKDTDEISRRHSQTRSFLNVMSYKHKRWCQRCKSSTHDTSFCRKTQPPKLTNSQTRQGAHGKTFVNYKQKWCEKCENKTHSTSDCRKLSKPSTRMRGTSGNGGTSAHHRLYTPYSVVRTNQGNQVIRHPRTTFGAVIVNVNKRSVSADVRAFTSNYLLGVDQVTKQNKMLHRVDL